MSIITATFDTNSLRPLVEQHKRTDGNRAVFATLENAFRAGKIKLFASDTIVNLEGKPRHGRQKHWESLTNVTTFEDKGFQVQEDGTEADVTNITITPTFVSTELPAPLVHAMEAAIALGVQFIKTPRVGMPMLPEHLYKPVKDAVLTHAIDGSCKAIGAFEARGCGSFHTVELAQEKAAKNPALLAKGMMAFAVGGSKNAISDALAEWSDGDSLAAHYGYQHDYFCTMDEGRGAGPKSILHLSHRAWLQQEFGIRIVSPEELLDIVKAG